MLRVITQLNHLLVYETITLMHTQHNYTHNTKYTAPGSNLNPCSSDRGTSSRSPPTGGRSITALSLSNNQHITERFFKG